MKLNEVFDQKTINAITSKDSLTAVGSLGPEAENSVTQYNDADDYKNMFVMILW